MMLYERVVILCGGNDVCLNPKTGRVLGTVEETIFNLSSKLLCFFVTLFNKYCFSLLSLYVYC